MYQPQQNLFLRPTMSITDLAEFSAHSPKSFLHAWSITNLLPTGLTLLTGESYSGKTALALHLAHCLATTTAPFNTSGETAHHFQTPPARTLFISLDSSTLHLQQLEDRLPKPSSQQSPTPRLHLTNTWKHLSDGDIHTDSGLQDLDTWFSCLPELRLIVLDNLASLRPLFRGSDRDLLAILRRLAEHRNISILVLHTCKRSTPLVTCADHHLHIKRSPIASYYQLDLVGKTLQPTTYLLHCSPSHIDFRFVTLHESLALNTLHAHKVLTPERLTILRLLHDTAHNLTPTQISTLLMLDYDCTRQLLSKMVKASLLLTTSRGHYTLHPFIQPLIPALLAQYPLLPAFTTAHLPPDDLADDLTPPPSDTPSPTATSHNQIPPHTPPKYVGAIFMSATSHNPPTSAQPANANALENTISHNPTNHTQPIHPSPKTSIAHNFTPDNNTQTPDHSQ